MKRIIVIITSTLMFCVLVFLLISISFKVRQQNQIKQNYEKLPIFAFRTLHDSLFLSKTIKEGPVLIIYFHPECEHCQYELSEIIHSKLIEADIWILMITPADISTVTKFKEENGLKDTQKAITLIDDNLVFTRLFGKAPIPTSIIYNKDLQLIKMFKGEVRPEAILKLLRVND